MAHEQRGRDLSQELVDYVCDHLFAANSSWPRDSFFSRDKYAKVLAGRIARAVGESPIEYALAWVNGERHGTEIGFRATVFTAEAVISGCILSSNNDNHPPIGDVKIVPRKAIRTLVLHSVYNFEDEKSHTDTFFTATYEGLDPVVVDTADYRLQRDGHVDKLFGALQVDLLETIVNVSPRS
ncbi:hypothetical protein [Arthrobacter sp. ISL-30]|uniref:hypothetical protein n=1 Tax=Arthrobacter sp. ISL-30 TaxID=2819109 RepID=UPI001BEA7623|nr:hypothetical protein [Arthrobacter sp. ISL-30]MBT2514680.1 hypothetical protein [Arthrobacter sp. ISL-30]